MILVDRDGPEGERLYLGDDGLHCGEGLEILLENGSWLSGRYETEHTVSEKRHVLFLRLSGHLEGVLTLFDGIEARRPVR